jgi:hypothetical protein
MKFVEVFQQARPDCMLTLRGQAMPVDNMVKVASFETNLPLPNALSEAFWLTNDSDEGGWENNSRLRVEALDRGNTSVGDVVVVDGDAYQCARDGWNKRPDFKPTF